MKQPPRFWEWLLERTTPREFEQELLGDLREEYREFAIPRLGLRRARRWYRSQALRSVVQNAVVHGRNLRRRIRKRRGVGEMMGAFFQDVRGSVRSARTNPLFAIVVVLTLGMGIGANSLIYSIVDSLVFNPFPFPEGERLVAVGSEYPRLGSPLRFIEHLSPAEYQDIRDETSSLQQVVAWDMGNRQIAGEDVAINVFTGFWWGDAFPTLGVTPVLGRGMLPEEIEGGESVAVISHRLWSHQFGADPDIIGSVLEITGNPYEVVGVMPEGTLLYGMDLWIPMFIGPEVYDRNRRQFQVLGRIAPGATMETVAAELEGLARRTEDAYGAEYEEYAGFRLTPATWTDANVSQFRSAALILVGAVGFVLLIVCANIANLLLSRSSGRRHEIAVRTALGAGRGRLLQQLLTESVVLAIAGGAIGVGAAYFGVQKANDLIQGVPFLSAEISLNSRVLFYTAVVAIGAGVLSGLAPALQTTTGRLQGVMGSDGGRSTASSRRRRLQRVFVGVEVAVAIVLLVGGGLLVNSFWRLSDANPGFDPNGVLTMRLTLPWEEYQGPQIAEFFEGLADRVRGMPGVTNASVASQFPPISFARSRIEIQGATTDGEGALPVALITQAGDHYFESLGTPLLRGRALGPGDVADGPLSAVVNETFARRYLGGREPLGARIRMAGDEGAPWIEVVGVVQDAHNRGVLVDPEPEVFGSVRQLSGTNNQLFLLVRTSVEPRSVLPGIRTAIQEFDADQPIYMISTMQEVFAGQTAPRSFAAVSMGVFALFALVLAALGIYAVVAFAVSDRVREIGLRLALGADPDSVRSMVIRQALVPVLIGAVVGLGLAVGLGQGLASLLYDVSATDPVTLVLVSGLLVSVALLAAWIPARRASALDPVTSLREG